MSLFVYNKEIPSKIDDNIKVIEFKCKNYDFDVCEIINGLNSECDTLIFFHKISQNLSDLNDKIKNINFFAYGNSINALPHNLENLWLCFEVKNNITNLPINLHNLYFMSRYNFHINNIFKYVTKIPHGCKLFISENDVTCKLKIPFKYKNISDE